MNLLRCIGIGCAVSLAGIALGGCASDSRPHDVPTSALRTAEGNQRLVYTAAAPGTVWVTEGSSNIIYSTNVMPGDRVSLDPDAGKVLLNDQVVLDKDVNHNDHKIFFMPGAAPPPTPGALAASDRTISRPDGVPMSAIVGGEGKDRVEYTAQRDGFIWVTDEDQHRVVYTAPVRRNDVVLVDPGKNLISVNGQAVLNQNVNSNNHRIFFGAERPAMVRTTVVEVPADQIVRPADVPTDAVSRVSGVGRIDFVADRDGTVWITDETTGGIVYTGRILHEDHLTIDPAGNVVRLNGQPVRTPALANDRYRVFFEGR